jgi:hypothetical protein
VARACEVSSSLLRGSLIAAAARDNQKATHGIRPTRGVAAPGAGGTAQPRKPQSQVERLGGSRTGPFASSGVARSADADTVVSGLEVQRSHTEPFRKLARSAKGRRLRVGFDAADVGERDPLERHCQRPVPANFFQQENVDSVCIRITLLVPARWTSERATVGGR